MSTLRELQRSVADAILGGNLEGENRFDASRVLPAIRLPDGADAALRLAIHIDGYPARVREALLESFPAVHHVVGERAFTGMVYRFLPELPEKEYNLNRVGRALADFLRRDPLTERLPFLSDLATLEWRLVEAFHAPSLEPFELGRCAEWREVDWRRAQFRFQPAVSVTCSNWPIREIWQARTLPLQEIKIDLVGRTDRVLVYRRGLAVECESLGESEAKLLCSLLGGLRLGEALEAIEPGEAEDTDLSQWFARWVSLGLITRVARS